MISPRFLYIFIFGKLYIITAPARKSTENLDIAL